MQKKLEAELLLQNNFCLPVSSLIHRVPMRLFAKKAAYSVPVDASACGNQENGHSRRRCARTR